MPEDDIDIVRDAFTFYLTAADNRSASNEVTNTDGLLLRAHRTGKPLLLNVVNRFIRMADEQHTSLGFGEVLGEIDPHDMQHERLRDTGISAATAVGITLVSCSMNRTENLLRSLVSWIALNAISEILIVDWSSTIPVRKSIADAGISDTRIRVIRVDHEPNWILSLAFNVGFRLANFDKILKVDADIVIEHTFFEKNMITGKDFIAGNWRTAENDQAYVNGFFFVPLKALSLVNGFNEFIQTYGWDDDDLYARLSELGFSRMDVTAGSIYHLSHDNTSRTGIDDEALSTSLTESLLSQPSFLIRKNRFVSVLMPGWSPKQLMCQFKRTIDASGRPVLTRSEAFPSVVPNNILEEAEFLALREIASWSLGRRVLMLSRDQFERISARTWTVVSPFDVEVELALTGASADSDGHYLVLMVPDQLSDILMISKDYLDAISYWAALNSLTIVAMGGPQDASGLLDAFWNTVPVLSYREDFESSPLVKMQDILIGVKPPFGDVVIDLRPVKPSAALVPHQISNSEPARLFIDAQHGLGNRIRAIGSAAAIAQATGRELVIIWTPDHHCQCKFSDLFLYSGQVLEEVSSDECRIYNYMSIEPGSEKNQSIDADSDGHIFIKSAFTLNSPHSNWNSENEFIRSLKPVPEVHDLLSSVTNPNSISAHVRMEAGPGLDSNSWDVASNWSMEDHEAIHKWRTKSHFLRFFEKIDKLIETDDTITLFVAADLPETYGEFLHKYESRVRFLKRHDFDRSKGQLIYALADAILLGRAKLFLGSNWSSFSELAVRLSTSDLETLMSGIDF